MAWSLGAPSVDDLEQILFDFREADAVDDWKSIDDRVMGGVSESEMVASDRKSALFRGQVSMENNGGFASVRSPAQERDWTGVEFVVLRVHGDGKTYSINLKNDPGLDGVTYRASFATMAGQWMTVVLPIRSFRPVFRGRPVPNAGSLDLRRVYSAGLMISGKQTGPFELELESIVGRRSKTSPLP
ncbi:CIA30 family protein [bacterium]|nr:CIA30 family protein [bacterium]